MRIVVVSGLSADSGCMLRARYLSSALSKAGASVRLATALRSLPFMLDWPISAVWNLRLLFSPCDVIIGCKPLPTVTPLLMLKKLLGTFTVVDIDDLDYAYRTGCIGRLARALQRPFPKRFDMVTYHSPELARVIVDDFDVREHQLVRLPQGVDLDLFSREPALHRQFRIEKRVVYPAHLNVASELEAVLDVVNVARKRVKSLRLLVIGGGPRERRFRRIARAKQVEDIAEFTGYVRPETVAARLAEADAGIVYYSDKTVNHYRESMKLREMLAMGMKVVCSDVGDLKQFAEVTYQASAHPEEVGERLAEVLIRGGDGREAGGPALVRRQMDWSVLGRSFYGELTAAATRNVHELSRRDAL